MPHLFLSNELLLISIAHYAIYRAVACLPAGTMFATAKRNPAHVMKRGLYFAEWNSVRYVITIANGPPTL